ncbi:hypothetical protein HYS47_00500 [Candidatus Woesearchaeota archaeon]|nr:hypothetical protein [Candidatus Woesearchaeota archaeon]
MTTKARGRVTAQLPKVELFGTVEQSNSIRVDKTRSRSGQNTYNIATKSRDRSLVGKYVSFNVDGSYNAIGLKPAKKK